MGPEHWSCGSVRDLSSLRLVLWGYWGLTRRTAEAPPNHVSEHKLQKKNMEGVVSEGQNTSGSITNDTSANQLTAYREMVRHEWVGPSTVTAWRKWYPKMGPYYFPLTEAIVELAQLEPGLDVLELASGQGDPAITLSEIVGPSGHVTLTDQSADMLEIAQDRAREAGLSNLSFHVVDAHSLPFPDGHFDRVTCRLGAMYFVDCQQVMRESRRVLKPGGRAVFVVWGPPHSNPLTPLFARVELPPPPPDMPQPFRYAMPGALAAEAAAAGFGQVRDAAREVMMPWPGPPEELWRHLYEVVTPLRELLDASPPEVIEAVIEDYRQGYDGHHTVTPTTLMTVSCAR